MSKRINLGKVAFTDRGVYSATETYVRLDFVSDGISTFYSRKDGNTGNALPTSAADAEANEWWGFLANVGDAKRIADDAAASAKATAEEAAKAAKETADTAAAEAKTTADEAAAKAKETADTAAQEAKATAEAAAEDVKAHMPRIVDEYWQLYDFEKGEYEATAYKAVGKSPKISDTGTWLVFNDDTQNYVDSGQSVSADYELTKEKVEAVLTGEITSHTHATEIEKALADAELTDEEVDAAMGE